MTVRNWVMGLLFITVISPILLYTDRLASFKSSSSRHEFIEDVTTFTVGGDARHLNVLPQEFSTNLKEPIGIVYSDDGAKSLENSDGQDVQLPDSREHLSSRVLYTTAEEDQSKRGNPIRQPQI